MRSSSAQTRLDRTDVCIGGLRGVLVTKAFDVHEHERHSLVCRQGVQALLDPGAQFLPFCPFLRRGLVRRRGIHTRGRIIGVEKESIQGGRRAALFGAQLIVACIRDNAQQPGLERPTAISTDMLESRYERVLRGVFRCRLLTQNAKSGAVHHLLVRPHELIESCNVTFLSLLYVCLLIHGTRKGTPTNPNWI